LISHVDVEPPQGHGDHLLAQLPLVSLPPC
jgi:hypothetical protein